MSIPGGGGGVILLYHNNSDFGNYHIVLSLDLCYIGEMEIPCLFGYLPPHMFEVENNGLQNGLSFHTESKRGLGTKVFHLLVLYCLHHPNVTLVLLTWCTALQNCYLFS